MDEPAIRKLIEQDHAHVWHPFTPMRQWRQREPLIIERAEGDFLIDVRGKRYIDGVSSLWCNVHGHRVPAIDQAVRDQLDRVAHTTMLGLSNVPATQLAARLCDIAPGKLNKVFYSDAGSTATEVAFKMAVGYWFHRGRPQRHVFIALSGAYHGDTTGSMSVGYSELFHKPFHKMTFRTVFTPAPDTFHLHEDLAGQIDAQPGAAAPHGSDAETAGAGSGSRRTWSLEDEPRCEAVKEHALRQLEELLAKHHDEVAAVVVEPIVQGAAGMVMQPPGFLKGVADLAKKHDTLLMADEVATGFGRTGRMFACEHEQIEPDLLCLAKGLTAGYLPLAATLCTDDIEQAFCGEVDEHKTLYHGHTYTGNPLGAAAALASLDLFERNDLLHAVNRKAERLAEWLDPLRDAGRYPLVADVRQRGLMVGIELSADGATGIGFDPSRRLGKEVCDACREQGVFVRPLGNVIILMPPLAIEESNLQRLAETVVEQIGRVTATANA